MSEFKVLIVGGSVAGLTLAHCLEKLDIRYEILEKHDEIAPQVGASVGIMPNGALILDQLGLFDDIESVIEPLEMAKIRYPDGFYFKSEYPLTMRAYFGYPISFLERQKFLSILYSKLHHKDRVHTGQKVLSVRDCGSHAVVKTADTEYTGHLVVGADGVHSIVRSELWKLANKFKAGTFQEDEKNALKVEYACIYGISTRVPGVKDGVQLSLISRGVTIHIFNGTNCKVFWFVIVRLEKNDVGSDRPRYDDMHARKICDSLQREKVDADLTFGDVWVNCDIFKMTPLEEGLYERWHFGRLFCIGDAVHKLTPNLGQGANLAIEDAAALANALCKANLGEAMLEAASMERLTRSVNERRLPAAQKTCSVSEFITRMQAGETMLQRVFGRYVLPALHDIPAGSSASLISGSERLDFIPLPARIENKRHFWWILFKSMRGFLPKCHIMMIACMGAMMSWWATWMWTYLT
ncbi:hypothetical protein RJ55_03676 [Drechmeria coniospora]|nr:hypothetical protein RJ55_03676 [Drechmeria coniospora]